MKALKIVISSLAVFALSSLVLGQTTPQSPGPGADAGTSGCCEWKDMSTQHGHKPRETMDRCHIADTTAYTRNAFAAKSTGRKCLNQGRVIESQQLKDLAVDLTNDRGQLSKGQNDFCIRLRRISDNRSPGPEEVETEATMDMGRVKVIRAVVRMALVDVDRYCAHVNFPLSGLWSITVKRKGPSGKEKAVFFATISGSVLPGPESKEESTTSEFLAKSSHIASLSFPIVVAPLWSQFPGNQINAPDSVTQETLTGIVTDAACKGWHNRKAVTPYSCTRKCVQDGANYALVVGHSLYILRGHPAELDDFAGVRAAVTGQVKGTRVWVDSVAKVKKEPNPRNHSYK